MPTDPVTGFRNYVTSQIACDWREELPNQRRIGQACLSSQNKRRPRKRLRYQRAPEKGSVLRNGGVREVLESRPQVPGLCNRIRVQGEQVVRESGGSRVARVVEVPGQHLPLSPLNEELCRVGHAEEGQLPVAVQIPRRGGGLERLVAQSRERILRKAKPLDTAPNLSRQGRGNTRAFIVRKDVRLIDIQEVKNSLEIIGGGRSGKVVAERDGRIACAAQVWGDDGVVLGEDRTNNVPSMLPM
jgi:hypothetical protein